MSVKKILTNEIYIGNYKVKDIEDYVEEYKIIEKDLFDKAKNLRYRYRERKGEMPKERKRETIEKIFNEYLNYLDELEEDGYRIM